MYSVNSVGNIVDDKGSLVAGRDSNGGYSSTKNAAGQVLTGVDKSGALTFGDAPASSAVPSIGNTPAVVSSKDMSGSFADNSASLATKTYQTPNGAIVDANGKVIKPAPGAAANGQTTDTTGTAVEKGAAGGAGSGAIAEVASGDPIYDSLQKWEQGQETKNEADAATKKQQVTDMLNTNLAANDANYAAQIQSIKNTYGSLIDTQTRINNLNVSRVKAYGLASGNAMGTPLEFTNAVTNEETAANAAIQKLDDSRDSLIAQAQTAQQSGDAKLLADSMDAIDKVESDMKATAAQLQTQVDQRFTSLQGIEKDQKAQLLQTQQNLMAAALSTYGQQYANETDNTKRDALIKNIIGQSGGLLDYGTVLTSLSANAASITKAKTDAATSAADLALKAAQTTEAKASAAKTFKDASTATTSQVFSAIDNLMGTKDKSGMPYTDANGKFTKGGFDALVKAAGENGVNRADFLKQYGGYLDPGGYANYGLTKAEADSLSNVNKVTPIVIPQAPNGTAGGAP